mmetsp:Transcript_2182/g.2299  ORF Transcript_2182/g.2299 Transcript_2182/m.2299 type:complete len:90 (+) Transcript_2182:897-1166(+)
MNRLQQRGIKYKSRPRKCEFNRKGMSTVEDKVSFLYIDLLLKLVQKGGYYKKVLLQEVCIHVKYCLYIVFSMKENRDEDGVGWLLYLCL